MADRIRLESNSSDYDNNKPPAGAKILKQDMSTTIEKITNGYLITNTYSGRYLPKGETDQKNYSYFSYDEKTYSKDNPVSVDTDEDSDVNIADVFKD